MNLVFHFLQNKMKESSKLLLIYYYSVKFILIEKYIQIFKNMKYLSVFSYFFKYNLFNVKKKL